MPRSTNRNLPKSADLFVIKEELMTGRRIVVAASAGPRLSGRIGIIVGQGATRDSGQSAPRRSQALCNIARALR